MQTLDTLHMTITPSAALSEILEVARAAAVAGDSARARHYFRNLTEIDPALIDGWLGYASCTTVLAERRALYARALELDPGSPEARSGLADAEQMIAGGKLLYTTERPAPQYTPLHIPAAAPASFVVPAAPAPSRPGISGLALAAVGLVGLAIMSALTGFGIFVLTSFWGFMLAFIAGPAVSELMVRATERQRKSKGGRPFQIAAGVGMILGGLAAMIFGAMLLSMIGAPLPAEAVMMARNSGVGTDGASVLLNNPGLLVFLSSAIASTVYRMR